MLADKVPLAGRTLEHTLGNLPPNTRHPQNPTLTATSAIVPRVAIGRLNRIYQGCLDSQTSANYIGGDFLVNIGELDVTRIRINGCDKSKVANQDFFLATSTLHWQSGHLCTHPPPDLRWRVAKLAGFPQIRNSAPRPKLPQRPLSPFPLLCLYPPDAP
jgi:hypothetical protein